MRESPQPQGFSLIFAAAWLGLVPKQISTGDRTILARYRNAASRTGERHYGRGSRVTACGHKADVNGRANDVCSF